MNADPHLVSIDSTGPRFVTVQEEHPCRDNLKDSDIKHTPNADSPSKKKNNTHLTADETGSSEHCSPHNSSSWKEHNEQEELENQKPMHECCSHREQVSEQESKMRSQIRKSTRERHPFDPSWLPSGMHEMEKLTMQIDQDSNDVERQEDQSNSSGACMIVQATEDGAPKTWRQALSIPQWRGHDDLCEADCLNAKPRSTPWDAHYTEDKKELEPGHVAIYKRISGQVMYLSTVTRPDIAYAVGRLSSGSSSPTRGLWERKKRLLRYLNGQRGLGIEYKAGMGALRMDVYAETTPTMNNSMYKLNNKLT